MYVLFVNMYEPFSLYTLSIVRNDFILISEKIK